MVNTLNIPKLIIVLLFAVLGVTLTLNSVLRHSDISKTNPNNPEDYLAFSTGARIVRLQNIKNLYSVEFQTQIQNEIIFPQKMDGLLAFRNPPFVALFFALINSFGEPTGYLSFAILNVFLLLLSVALLMTKFGIKHVWILAFLPFFTPVFNTLVHGQLSIIILLVFVSAFLLLKSRLFFLMGLIVGFLYIKPTFLLFVPFSLVFVENKVAYLKGFLLSFLGLVFVDHLLYGSTYLVDYVRFLFLTETFKLGTDFTALYNFSAILQRFGVQASFTLFINILMILMGIFLLYRSKIKNIEKFCVSLLFVNVLNLHTMDSDLVIQLIPLLYFIKQGSRKFWVFGVLLFLLPYLGYFRLQFLYSLFLFLMSWRLLRTKINI